MPRKRAITKRKQPKKLARAKTTQRKPTLKKKMVITPAPIQWSIRVARYNPLMDFQPRTHEYQIAPREGESVLDLLLRIKHTQDGSLTFRGSCGYGGCGTCGVKVNGKTILSCVSQVNDLLDAHKGMRIDPLHENVLKDLVVNEDEFFRELTRVKPWIVPRKNDEKRQHKMGQAEVKKMGNTPQCILCGICNASSESSKTGEMGPAAFVKAYRYMNDVRDGDTNRLNALQSRLPVHYSLSKANECPRDISPGDKIHELRQNMQKNQMKSDKSKKKE